MGLDMYITKMKVLDGYSFSQCSNAPYYYEYIGKIDEQIRKELEGFDLTEEDLIKMKNASIEKPTEVAYFRKFNALHKWFQDNIMDEGLDDNCTYYEIDENAFKQLKSDLKEVKDSIRLVPYRESKQYQNMEYNQQEELNRYDGDVMLVDDISVCEKLLPSSSGFFFGSTVYGEYYAECVNEALEQLESVSLNDDEVLLYYAWY